MIDYSATHLALRNRALAVSVATTGSASLSATAEAYERAAGSFIDDRFEAGMECVGAGCAESANNTVGLITGVTATRLYIDGGRTVEVVGPGKTISVGFPAQRQWEGVELSQVVGRPYVEEEFMVAQHALESSPAEGAIAWEKGLYILRFYFPALFASIGGEKQANAILALFTPGTVLAAGANSVRIRQDIGPFASRFQPNGRGHLISTLTIPWESQSTNTVAA